MLKNKTYFLLKHFLLSSFFLKDLSYTSFKNKRFFLLKKNYRFFNIPLFLDFKKVKNKLSFKSQNFDFFSIYFYSNQFLYWLKSSNKKVKQKLILKGLGFRSYLSDDQTKIFFKIGLSHIVSLKIPKKIFSVVIEKNFLIFEGYDNIVLGNFCKRVKKLKKVDVYKSKGFLNKNENVFLKPIKKT
jgi:hypothetical protein